MPAEIPIVHTAPGAEDDDQLTWIQLPADVADELTLTTAWLSVQLEHRVPLDVLRRALLMGGLAHPRRALAALAMARVGCGQSRPTPSQGGEHQVGRRRVDIKAEVPPPNPSGPEESCRGV